jgi:hypothetical protein
MNRISNCYFLKVATFILFFLTASQVCMAREEVPLLPMTVQGTALVDGSPAPIGTIVAAYLNGEQVGKLQVSSSSEDYCFWISGTAADDGKTVRFTVNGKDTGKILTWKSGKQVLSFQLSVGKGVNSENYVKSLTSIINSESLAKAEKPKTLGKDLEVEVFESSVPEPDVNFLKSMSASSSDKEAANPAEYLTELKNAPGFIFAFAVAGIIVIVFGFNLVRKRD